MREKKRRRGRERWREWRPREKKVERGRGGEGERRGEGNCVSGEEEKGYYSTTCMYLG